MLAWSPPAAPLTSNMGEVRLRSLLHGDGPGHCCLPRLPEVETESAPVSDPSFCRELSRGRQVPGSCYVSVRECQRTPALIAATLSAIVHCAHGSSTEPLSLQSQVWHQAPLPPHPHRQPRHDPCLSAFCHSF